MECHSYQNYDPLDKTCSLFAGKMLAKLGRILMIAEELKELCGQGTTEKDISIDYKEVCDDIKVPSDRDINKSVASLRRFVEVWLNGEAVTPFVYDDACK